MKIEKKKVVSYEDKHIWEEEDISPGNGYYSRDNKNLILIIQANWVNDVAASYLLYNTKANICFGGFNDGPTTKQVLLTFLNTYNCIPKDIFEKSNKVLDSVNNL